MGFVYADVSREKDARARVGMDTSVFDGPEFVHVGYAQTSGYEASWVSRVLRTPDGSAYVTATRASHMTFDTIECSTLLEDGALVQTAMLPPFGEWWHVLSGINHPARKSHSAFAFTRTIEGLLAKHRAVVARVSARAASPIVPASDMHGYFAIRLRGRALLEARSLLHERATVALGFAVLAGIVAIVLKFAHWHPGSYGREALAIVGLVASIVAIAACPLLSLISKYPAALVAGLLTRGPAPVPASILLQRASKIRHGWIGKTS